MLAFHKCISGDEPSIGTNCALKSDLRKSRKLCVCNYSMSRELGGCNYSKDRENENARIE